MKVHTGWRSEVCLNAYISSKDMRPSLSTSMMLRTSGAASQRHGIPQAFRNAVKSSKSMYT
eukprot:scaffold133279_cov69-Phaeocystis_antarctica.AAC.5